MPIYLNKSILINAIQYNNNFLEIENFIEGSNAAGAKELNNVVYLYVQTFNKAAIETLILMPNDFLVKDATNYLTIYPKDQFTEYWFQAPEFFKIN
ncbi:hypothetical protein EBR66_07260 [bacterium]|nr:hypothetical protein [bacterium]